MLRSIWWIGVAGSTQMVQYLQESTILIDWLWLYCIAVWISFHWLVVTWWQYMNGEILINFTFSFMVLNARSSYYVLTTNLVTHIMEIRYSCSGNNRCWWWGGRLLSSCIETCLRFSGWLFDIIVFDIIYDWRLMRIVYCLC